MEQPPSMDPVSAAAVVLGLFIGPELAALAGTYSVLVIGWCLGVMVGAMRLPPGARSRLLLFVVLSAGITFGTAWTLSDLLAQAANRVLPDAGGITARGLLFIVAFAIPAVGHSWGPIAAWCLQLVRRRFERQEGKQ